MRGENRITARETVPDREEYDRQQAGLMRDAAEQLEEVRFAEHPGTLPGSTIYPVMDFWGELHI